ncbi:MAG: ATP-binding cassette domain-containing protein [Ruminococcaceae bacterium]|nr:ATP-binding cassette domain-containing protein [Oscillospiraceae bacterium]
MLATDKIPLHIYKSLSEQGIHADKISLATYCDMNEEHVLCDTYVLATLESIYVISGTTLITSSDKKTARKPIEAVWLEKSFSKYDICDIDELSLDELISSARFTVKLKSGERMMLSTLTNTCRESVLVFIKYFERIKKGEITGVDFEIDDEDEPAHRCCPKCGMRYPDKNRRICPKCMEKGKLYMRFGMFLVKYKGYIAIMLLSLVLLTATSIFVPYLSSQFFFDEVLTEGGSFFGQLLLVIAMIVATRLLSQLFSLINGMISARVSAKVVYDLKMTIFGSIEKLSMSFFNSRQTGALMTQVNDDSNTMYYFFCDGVPYFLVSATQVIVLIVLLFIENPLLALCSLATVPLFFALILKSYRKSEKLHAKSYSSKRALNSHLSDVLGGMRVVKAFAQESREIKKFDGKNKRAAHDLKQQFLFNNYVYPFLGVVLFLGNIIALGVGGYMVMTGYNGFTYGQLIKFVAYVNMIYSPMYFFADMIDWSAEGTNALQRLFEIYDTEPDIAEATDAINIEQVRGDVEFRNVHFEYVKNHKIIDNVSFKVEAGKTLGIVGHTGAGKSTLVNLIMRLYDSNSGEILIDGVDVKKLSFSTLYDNISIVSQEAYFFIGTVFDNIRYAAQDATYEQVISAAKLSGAHDFIMKLPEGYDTMIGFGYKELSGGEKQRLSIARAILRDPKILILDEATAAMDTETEKRIQNAINSLTRGKTTIMIAHRLSTLRDADELIVIEDGRVVESGTHNDLLQKQDGVYRKLYTLQSEALKNAGILEKMEGADENE